MLKNKMNAIATLLLLFIITIYACDDPCKDVTCPPNSVCIEGDCICDEGYVADANGNCILESSDFAGTWNASEECSISGNYTYTIDMEDSSNYVIINNIFEEGERTTCELSSDGQTCTILPNQTVSDLPISGTCTLNNDGSANLDYILEWNTPNTADTCSVDLMK